MSETKERHKLIIRPRSAVTGCGVRIEAFYPQSSMCLAVNQSTLMPCTLNDSEVVGCPECEAAAKAG